MPNSIARPNLGSRRDLDVLREYMAQNGKFKGIVEPNLALFSQTYRLYKAEYFRPAKRLLSLRKKFTDAATLAKLYTSTKSCFDYIEVIRLSEKLGCCPYCALQKGKTVDHYLPEDGELFPHLAVFSLNLIPSCNECQSRKGSFFQRNWHKRSSRFRRIVHPYFDSFLAVQNIEVKFNMAPKIHELAFEIQPARKLPPNRKRLVAFHLKKLAVMDRAQQELRRVWEGRLESFRGRDLHSAEEVRFELICEIAAVDKRSGVANSIEAAFLRSLLRNEAAILELLNQSKCPRAKPVHEITARRRRP